MKKLLIFLLIVTALVASVPLIWSEYASEALDTEVNKLTKRGLVLLKEEKKQSYLQTHRDYEFILNGNRYGLHLQHSNIPLAEDIYLELSLKELSKKLQEQLEIKDKEFLAYIQNFLENKGFLIKLKYNIMSGDFTGEMKDINEHHVMTNNSELIVQVKGTKFEGNTDFKTTDSLKITNQKLHIKVQDLKDEMYLELINPSVETKLEQERDQFKVYSKVHLDNLVMKSNEKVDIQGFDYELTLSDLTKEDYREYIKSQKTEADLYKLISKGIKIELENLASNNIKLNGEDLKGFAIKSDLQLKEDKNFAWKMAMSPILVLPNIEVDFKSQFSEEVFSQIIQSSVIPLNVFKYKTAKQEDIVIDFSYKEGVMIVNGEKVLG